MRHVASIVRGVRSRKRWRYIMVSLVSVVVAHTVLILCFGVLTWSARVSNLVAFVAGAVPGYTLNRRWTWGRTDRSRLLAEVGPYWVLSATGLAVSTWAVGAAEGVARQLSDSRAAQTLIVLAAAVATTGVLWIIKYVAFDRLVFGRAPDDTVTDPGCRLRTPPGANWREGPGPRDRSVVMWEERL